MSEVNSAQHAIVTTKDLLGAPLLNMNLENSRIKNFEYLTMLVFLVLLSAVSSTFVIAKIINFTKLKKEMVLLIYPVISCLYSNGSLIFLIGNHSQDFFYTAMKIITLFLIIDLWFVLSLIDSKEEEDHRKANIMICSLFFISYVFFCITTEPVIFCFYSICLMSQLIKIVFFIRENPCQNKPYQNEKDI